MKSSTEFIHLLRSAIEDFRRNKVRTALTSLGITIGVLSVVMLIALGLGLKNYIKDQFENLGTNLIFVLPGSGFTGEGGGGSASFGAGLVGGAQFDEKDVSSLRRISSVKYVVPVFMKSTVVESDGNKEFGYIMGTSEDTFEVLNLQLEAGVEFTKADVDRRAKVAVLGNTVAEKLFQDSGSAVGKTVRFMDQRIKVVGVAEKKGDNEMDAGIFMPYKTTFGGINPDKTFFTIYLGVESEDQVEEARLKAEEVLLKRYEEDEFSVSEQSQILSTVNTIFNVINAILVAIGSISLLVGGIGIMNIMYATVTERTKEVGIRRAVGATQKDILMQFLAESVLLSLFGGTLGLLIAALIVLLVRPFFPIALNLLAVAIALLVSSGIGIFFGVFPARRAAGLAPIEAIRYE
jgi:putative ABC transport system permease protein